MKLGEAYVEIRSDMRKIQSDLSKLKSTVEKSTKDNQKRFDSLNFKRAIKSVNNFGKSLFNLKTIAASLLIGWGVNKISKSFLEAANATEGYRVRLNVLLGSVEEGNKLFKGMADYASRVPFTYDEIMGSATQLSGVMRGGVKEIEKWIPLIGDLAAASGLDIRTTTEQVIRMYSAGAASADLFRERGINAMMGFQAGVSYSAEETRKKMFEEWEKTGSQFRGATEALSHTWEGTMSMFSDAWFQFRTVVMDAGLLEFMKNMAKEVLNEINKLKESGGLQDLAEAIAVSVMSALVSIAELVRSSMKMFMAFRNSVARIASWFQTLRADVYEWSRLSDKGEQKSIGFKSQIAKGKIDMETGSVEVGYLTREQNAIVQGLRQSALDWQGVAKDDIATYEQLDRILKGTIETMKKYREIASGTKTTGTSSSSSRTISQIPTPFKGFDKDTQAMINRMGKAYKFMNSPGLMAEAREIISDMGAEELKLREGITAKIKKLTLSELEYKKWELNKEVEELRKKAGKDQELLGMIDEYHQRATEDIGKVWTTTFGEDLKSAMVNWANSWSSTLNDMLWGAETTFGEILRSFAKMITQMIVQKKFVEPLFSSIFNVLPFAKGGVLSGPTVFPMANGYGLAGEAGYEGLLPLKRNPQGELGVMVSGGKGKRSSGILNVTSINTSKQNNVRTASKNVNIIMNNPTFQDMATQKKTFAQMATIIASQVAPGAVVNSYNNDGKIRNIIRKGS